MRDPNLDASVTAASLIALSDGLQVQWLIDPADVDFVSALRHQIGELITVAL